MVLNTVNNYNTMVNIYVSKLRKGTERFGIKECVYVFVRRRILEGDILRGRDVRRKEGGREKGKEEKGREKEQRLKRPREIKVERRHNKRERNGAGRKDNEEMEEKEVSL